MKKFILASVFVVAASSVLADDAAPAKQSWSDTISGYCKVPACVTNARKSVDTWISANPEKAVLATAVATVLVVKALDYAFAANEDEEAGF